jgi:DNA polymerase-1
LREAAAALGSPKWKMIVMVSYRAAIQGIVTQLDTEESVETKTEWFELQHADAEDLAQQIPYIRRALAAYRIPILELPGYEADDVIGTLAHKATGEGYSVFVVSSDKDMMQLVNQRICVLNPPKDNLICDAAKVEDILGVPPERVVDVMALRGDSIDNPASATKARCS